MDEGIKHCIFCDIIAGKADAYRIYENEHSLCILDIHPFARGHCLVIPKRHVPWWYELTEKETESVYKLARMVSNKIMQTYQPDFVCLFVRGTRIPHAHIHLVPTYSGDPLDSFFNAVEKFQEATSDLSKLTDREALGEVARNLVITR